MCVCVHMVSGWTVVVGVEVLPMRQVFILRTSVLPDCGMEDLPLARDEQDQWAIF